MKKNVIIQENVDGEFIGDTDRLTRDTVCHFDLQHANTHFHAHVHFIPFIWFPNRFIMIARSLTSRKFFSVFSLSFDISLFDCRLTTRLVEWLWNIFFLRDISRSFIGKLISHVLRNFLHFHFFITKGFRSTVVGRKINLFFLGKRTWNILQTLSSMS